MGKSDPKVLVDQWTRKITHEIFSLDRILAGISREEFKIKASIKEAAAKGVIDVARFYAKQLVKSNKNTNKLLESKAHLNSMKMQLKEQLSFYKTTGELKKSTQVLKSIQALVNVPEIAGTMRDLAKELMKAGILGEMANKIFDSLSVTGTKGQEEEEVEEEIQRVLLEVTTTPKTGLAGKPSTSSSAASAPHSSSFIEVLDERNDVDKDEGIRNRLEKLRN